jgi:hypothetical protein
VGVLAADKVDVPKVFDLVLELELKTELAAAGEDEEACVDIDWASVVDAGGLGRRGDPLWYVNSVNYKRHWIGYLEKLESVGSCIVLAAGIEVVSWLLSTVTDSDTSTTVVPKFTVWIVSGSLDDTWSEPTACTTECAVMVVVIWWRLVMITTVSNVVGAVLGEEYVA